MQGELAMKVPKDQPLFLVIFYTLSFTLILVMWLLLPAHRQHEGEENGEKAVKIQKPEVVIENTGAALTRAEEVLTQLEKALEAKSKEKKKASQKGGAKK